MTLNVYTAILSARERITKVSNPGFPRQALERLLGTQESDQHPSWDSFLASRRLIEGIQGSCSIVEVPSKHKYTINIPLIYHHYSVPLCLFKY